MQIFKAGDTVLAPDFGDNPLNVYTVEVSEIRGFTFPLSGNFAPDYENVHCAFDDDGKNNLTKMVFHDTPANRQAIATLYEIDYQPQAYMSQFSKSLPRLQVNNITLQNICTALYSLAQMTEKNTGLVLFPLVEFMGNLLESNDKILGGGRD